MAGRRALGVGLGLVGGGSALYWFQGGEREETKSHPPFSLPEKLEKWDWNWDGAEGRPSRGTRRLILVRHGEYETWGKQEEDQKLTERGRSQARATGERLKTLGIFFDKLIVSDLTRAQETADLISGELGKERIAQREKAESLLAEGYPCYTEPPSRSWRQPHKLLRQGGRIEAAFRRHFHRSEESFLPSAQSNSTTLIVGHANVIRYFLCRALQLPPEGWLRIALPHASITQILIREDGAVVATAVGEAAHMPPQLFTISNLMEPPSKDSSTTTTPAGAIQSSK